MNTDIITPNGIKKLKDIHEGDYVFGEDGKPTKVLAESEIFKNHDCYKVTFEDGEEIVADAGHLWKVITKKSKEAFYRPIKREKSAKMEYREDKGYFTIQTKDMVHDFKRIRADGKGIEYKYRVPMAQPVEFEKKELPINPYTLGYWLGDGDSCHGAITVGRQDIKATSDNLMNVGNKIKIKLDKRCYRALCHGLQKKLRINALLKNKHIPEEYFFASIEQRKELLKGLMDSDGTILKSGQCSWSQKSDVLTRDFSRLLSSLGIKHNTFKKVAKCTYKGEVKECNYNWISFFVDKENSCFKLQRKHERLKNKLTDRMKNKSITNIEKVDSVDVKCLYVDNESHTFLCGKKNTVTHNTLLSAAIILYIMLFSEEAAQEVYSVATDRQQSKIIWEYAKQMIATSPLLKKYFKIRVNEIVVKNGFNKFVPLSKNSGSMDGLSPSVMALDELHAIKDRNLYDVVKGGMYSRVEPLTLIMSTGGYIEQDSIFDSKYQEYLSIIDGYEDGKYTDETVLPLLYELDGKQELNEESAWMKANPNLGVSKSIEMLRQEVKRAMLNEKTLRDLLVKQFNIRENARDTFFSFADIDNEEIFDLRDFQGKYFLGGIDLSQTTDLTAATALIPCDGKLYVQQMYWIPKDTLQEHIEKDQVPYDIWISRGLMRTCEGRIINPSDICQWFMELQNEYGLYAYKIGYDRYNASYLVKEQEENLGKELCKTISQSFIGLSTYMFESKAYFKSGKIIYNKNPVFQWCLLNTLSVTDTSGNIKPYKNRNLTKRIDGYSSFLDAFVLYLDNKGDL